MDQTKCEQNSTVTRKDASKKKESDENFITIIEEGEDQLTVRVKQRDSNVDTIPKQTEDLQVNDILMNQKHEKHEEQLEPNQQSTKDEKEKSPDLTGLSDLFTIDTSPAPEMDCVRVPSYKRVIKNVLDEESVEKKKQKHEIKCERPRSNGCFNCGSVDHGMHDCPHPRNHKRINRARQTLYAKNERYHVNVEQRFASMRPGQISDTLRHALNLQRRELPNFIYKMRMYGYPPGWLEEAKVVHSGLTLINTQDLDEPNSSNSIDTHDKFDVSKLIDFPGFNAPVQDDFFDDYIYHNVPPLERMQTKREFIKALGNNVVNSYQRKKSKHPIISKAASQAEADVAETIDMDIDDSDPESNEDTRLPKLHQQENILNNSDDTDNYARLLKNASLSSLQEQYERILNALASEEDPNSQSFFEDTGGNETLIKEALLYSTDSPNENTPKKDDSQNAACASGSTQSIDNCASPTDRKSTQEFILESHIGTPILKFSPFDKLPAGENFKVGVSDVINFENLPGSTGTYENMKTVIKRVRKFVKLHNNN